MNTPQLQYDEYTAERDMHPYRQGETIRAVNIEKTLAHLVECLEDINSRLEVLENR